MKYKVEVMLRAVYDMRNIYHYIMHEFGEIDTADGLLNDLQSAIDSLEILPYRCALRKTGIYAALQHRQLFVKNFTIVYRVDESFNRVLVAAVRYTPSSF